MNSHPIHMLKKPKKWAQPAAADIKSRGTEGSLTKIAQSHGQSPLAFARANTSSPNPAIREKSLFAANLNKGR